ncbi:MAG: hypothetical protein E7617_00370 [Ruminococcaceae bacterium]|nr:hypothetical protein [Oscillospiraceae bacterium]
MTAALSIADNDANIYTLKYDICTAYYKIPYRSILDGGKKTAACSAIGICAIIFLVRIKIPTVLIEVVYGMTCTVEGTLEYLTAKMLIVITDRIKELVCKVDIDTELYSLTREGITAVNKISEAGELLCSRKGELGDILVIPSGIRFAVPFVCRSLYG